jgi:hypothetical protein
MDGDGSRIWNIKLFVWSLALEVKLEEDNK